MALFGCGLDVERFERFWVFGWDGSSGIRASLCLAAHFKQNGAVPVSVPEELFWWFQFRLRFLKISSNGSSFWFRFRSCAYGEMCAPGEVRVDSPTVGGGLWTSRLLACLFLSVSVCVCLCLSVSVCTCPSVCPSFPPSVWACLSECALTLSVCFRLRGDAIIIAVTFGGCVRQVMSLTQECSIKRGQRLLLI